VTLYLLSGLEKQPWWRYLRTLADAIEARNVNGVIEAYRDVFRCVLERDCRDLAQVAAEDLLWCDSFAGRYLESGAQLTGSANGALRLDIEALILAINRDWQGQVAALTEGRLPSLSKVSLRTMPPEVSELSTLIKDADPVGVIRLLGAVQANNGLGQFARYKEFIWQGGCVPVPQPAPNDARSLVDLDEQLDRLFRNTEALLCGGPSQHVLLYGPRGTGKSTAIRGLLYRYGERGLRLIEVNQSDLGDLSDILFELAQHAQKFVVFIDDLSFDRGEAGHRALKGLIEGGVGKRPDNVRFYATSNRRHLIRESFADRPDSLDDDVNPWDSHNENLSLADRFGLTITFPSQTQHSYLRIVKQLASREGMCKKGLGEKAIRYADWGNGYSGRTARQFIDSLKVGLID
jgi:predicted AAA+ superfamily ATPase